VTASPPDVGWTSIKTEIIGTLGLITLNRPESRNPMDRTTATELLAAFELFFGDDRVRSIGLTGAGKAFCAGGDLQQMKNFSTMGTAAAFEWPAPIVELNRRMLSAPKPVIAAVNGPAYAGGMGLAGMCDIILATPAARFATPEVKVGIFPMIIVAHLCRAIPRKRLVEMMFTGEPMSAEEGHRLGFVNRIYENTDDMMKGLQDYADKLSQASPDAIRLGRRTFSLLSEMTADQALDAAQFMLMPFHLGADIAEGADAFLERRPPSWAAEPGDAGEETS
jgi:enoyl-CoA hydratase/carnithine racemase